MNATLYGLIAWLAFGVVEIFFLTFLPGILDPASFRQVPHPGFTALLMALYAACGALLGAALGWLFPRLPEPRLEVAATSTVLTGYAVLMLIDMPERPMARLGLLAAPFLLLAALLSLRRDWLGRALRGFRNPWTASVLLLLPPWIAVSRMDERPLLNVGAAIAGAMAAVWLVSTAILLRADRLRWPSLGRQTLAVSAIAVLACLVGATIRQQPFEASRKPGPALAGKPNVILITLDTVRADHLSVYGYERETTPHLKEFAKEAVLYKNSFSSGDMTLSTHGSIFTGLYAARHGAHRSDKNPGGRRLAESYATLTEILASKGYSTSAVVANLAFLTPLHGLVQGFARCDHRAPTPFLGVAKAYSMRARVRNLLTRISVPREFDQISRRAGEINAAAYREVDRMAALNRPFFLFLNYMDAHWPYNPPAPYDRLFPGLDESWALARYFTLADEILLKNQKPSAAQLQHLHSQYDGAIAYMDAEMERLFTKLRRMGLYEDSLIAITSDHGEAFGERNLFGHGVSVYQDQVSVPLLIKYPRAWRERNSGVTRGEPAGSVDLMPTILEAAGYEIPENLDGMSLLALERGKTRPVYSESYSNDFLLKKRRSASSLSRSVVAGRWKLIGSAAKGCELFDLQSDPGETRNVCQTQEAIGKELASNLKLLSRRAAADNPSVRPDAQTMETLRSLGYVQ